MSLDKLDETDIFENEVDREESQIEVENYDVFESQLSSSEKKEALAFMD